MSFFSFDAKLEGLENVEASLKAIDQLSGMEILNGVARSIQEQTRRRITSEKTSPSGEKWKANTTKKPILYDSGALTRSIDYVVSEEKAIIGSGLVYAAIHQFGGVITPKKAKRLAFRIGNRSIFAKKVTIPARAFLGVSQENAKDILDDVAEFIRKKMGK